MMLSVLWNILIFVLVISVLVGFHEWGHFLVARLCGIKVLRFSIGFGKPLFTYRNKHDTEYVVSMLPFGGYVKMLDETEGPVAESEKQFAFNTQPLWKRFSVVFAGPMFNFILAIFAYWIMFMVGIKDLAPIIGDVTPASIASQAGLISGDEIVQIENQSIKTFSDVQFALVDHMGEKGNLKIAVKHGNNAITWHTLNLANWHVNSLQPNLLDSLGIQPNEPPIPTVISQVIAGSGAENAGIQTNDKILAIDGKNVQSWQDMLKIIQAYPKDKPLTVKLTVLRNQNMLVIPVVATLKDNAGVAAWTLGIYSEPVQISGKYLRLDQAGPLQAFSKALHKTWDATALTLVTLGKLVTGHVSVQSLSGPVGIAQAAGQSASIGISYLLQFVALISVSLGVLNLLPIPVLDGGHLLYFIIEGIRGKPLSETARLNGIRIGFILLLLLMAVALFNDMHRLFV